MLHNVKLFENFSNLYEGQIRVFKPNNPFKPADGEELFGVKIGKGLEWKPVYDAFEKWLDQGFGITITVAEFIPNSEQLGYNKKTTNPKYRSEINGTWDDKSLPLFTDEHPRYDESQFDVLKVDKKFSNIDGSNPPHIDGIYIRDEKGNEFCVHASRILDVQLGSSLRDKIIPGTKYGYFEYEYDDNGEKKIEKNAVGTIVNYQNGKVYVKIGKDDIREYTIADWKAKRFRSMDESKLMKNFNDFRL